MRHRGKCLEGLIRWCATDDSAPVRYGQHDDENQCQGDSENLLHGQSLNGVSGYEVDCSATSFPQDHFLHPPGLANVHVIVPDGHPVKKPCL